MLKEGRQHKPRGPNIQYSTVLIWKWGNLNRWRLHVGARCVSEASVKRKSALSRIPREDILYDSTREQTRGLWGCFIFLYQPTCLGAPQDSLQIQEELTELCKSITLLTVMARVMEASKGKRPAKVVPLWSLPICDHSPSGTVGHVTPQWSCRLQCGVVTLLIQKPTPVWKSRALTRAQPRGDG